MFDLSVAWKSFQAILHSEFGRVLATLSVFLLCWTASWVLVRYLARDSKSRSADYNLTRRVLFKNLIWAAGILAVILIWASKIAGFVLSVAALAGAILLVNKELLMSLVGYFVLAVQRPFRTGDWIEISHFKGQVIDMSLLHTTLAESVGANQATGAVVLVPNALVLAHGIRNLSATGMYMVVLYRISLPYDVNHDTAEKAALAAADAATSPWRGQADAAFERIEASQFIELPSSKPKVLWESIDTKSQNLYIRFACPVDQRVQVEQVVFREFWKAMRAQPQLQGSKTE